MQSNVKHYFLVAYKLGGSAVDWANCLRIQNSPVITASDLKSINEGIRDDLDGDRTTRGRDFVVTNISALGAMTETEFGDVYSWQQPKKARSRLL